MTYEAGRIKKAYEGKSFIGELSRYLVREAKKYYPDLHNGTWVTGMTSYNDRCERQNILQIYSSHLFKSFVTMKSGLLNTAKKLDSYKKYNVSRIYSNDKHILTSDLFDNILDRNFMVAYGNYLLISSTTKEVENIVKTQHSYVTTETDAANARKVTAFSYSDSFIVEVGVAYVVYIRTNDTELALSHAHTHLIHAHQICSPNKEVRFTICLSPTIDLERFVSEIENEEFRWTPSDMSREYMIVCKKDYERLAKL